MELKEIRKKINKGRSRDEAAFVFALWKDPELYSEYLDLEDGKQKTFVEKDATFYYNLGKQLFLNGYKNFDAISLESYLANKPTTKDKFETYGGMRTVEEFKAIVDTTNIDAYYDGIARRNSLISLAEKYDKVFENVETLQNVSNEEVYDIFDGINSTVALTTSSSEQIEDLSVTKEFVESCQQGENIGYSYGKRCPLLNYITLGAAKASAYMLGGHSGVGKSSFVFEQMLTSFVEEGLDVAILSNEMKIDRYQTYLLEHILVRDLDYYGLTTKQIRMGKYNAEQKEKIDEAMKISEEKYKPHIKFIKIFDNSTDKILKYMKKLNAYGVSIVLIDTFKVDDKITESAWLQLSIDARRIFQCASKLDMCVLTTYQLALHTLNQRFLDVTCLSNSKQIKEVYETMVYCRRLWHDEYPGEKYDVHPYRISKDNNKIRESIELDPEKTYVLFFIDKTRSDSSQQVLIYEWAPHFNKWKELGFATVINEHRNY